MLEIEFDFVQIFDVDCIGLPDLRLLQVYDVLLLGQARVGVAENLRGPLILGVGIF